MKIIIIVVPVTCILIAVMYYIFKKKHSKEYSVPSESLNPTAATGSSGLTSTKDSGKVHGLRIVVSELYISRLIPLIIFEGVPLLDQSDNQEENEGPEALDGLIETNVIPSLHKEYEIFSEGCSIDRLVVIIELIATVVLRSIIELLL